MSRNEERTAEVQLPRQVVSRVERRLPRTEFESVDEYVAYVLREVLARVEDESTDSYEAVDREQVQDRLRSLGYLDT
ncbi:hypothetical protein ACFQH6_08180 [Halobacteriaceae archaeon GCM10025711]